MSPIPLSKRARNTPPSPIRKLAHLATAAREAGKHVYPLNIGQPDIKTPTEFFDGIRNFKEEVLEYGPSQGEPALLDAWTKYFNRSNNLSISSDQMLITTGASEALVVTFMTVCDPGDEVIIFDPTYANYIGFSAIAGINLVPVASAIDRNFAVPADEKIEQAITPETHAILLCSPNNPTGTVYSKEEVQRLLDICNKHNLFLIVDETYRELVYDGLEPFSVYHLDSNNDRVIVIDSLSKRFSLCGARIGCVITTNKEVLAKGLNQAQARLAVATIEQRAAAHMLETVSDQYLVDVKAEFEKRRDVLFKSLSALPGLVVHKPMGAFYTVVQVPVQDAEDFAAFLLRDFSYKGATTFVAPASGFYMNSEEGKDKLRIAYVLEPEAIESAVEIIGRGLEAYIDEGRESVCSFPS